MHERIEAANGGTVAGSQASAVAPAQTPLASVRLHPRHDVNSFSCPRSARVEGFIKTRAAHYEAKNYARVFVFEAPDDNTKIEGYYTLAAYSLVHAEAITGLSNSKRKQIEGSIPVPLVLVGYMGRDANAPVGTGADLILDAARRAHSNSDIASWGLILHAEANDRGLVKWYANKMNFEEVLDANGVPTGIMFARYKWLDSNLS